MLDDRLIKSIDATSEMLDVDRSVIEKDYYVTKAIHALCRVEDENFCLVFAGGTCLAKAHKIVRRMSEDIDFKVKHKNADITMSKTKFLNQLKYFRTIINSIFSNTEFTTSNTSTRNEGKYLKIELAYNSVFPASRALRPHLLLEFTLSDIRLDTKNLSVQTLIEETLKSDSISESSLITCVSSEETAIEKWVGLTRKIVAIERGYCQDDSSLVRHVYDLNAIIRNNHIKDDFFKLAFSVIKNDADQFKNQHPEYAANPPSEISSSLEILSNDHIWESRYIDFIESMVFDRVAAPSYEKSIETIANISTKLIKSIAF
jgi:predicted nucleotidyltransferase component of viral defense system